MTENPASGEAPPEPDAGQEEGPSEGRAVSDLFATHEIFRRIVATAHQEFRRSPRQIFFSGLAAGFSMSLSFLAAVNLEAMVGGPHARAIGATLYPIGFLIVVMGRYQLFTENTLTPVTLVLMRKASVPMLLQLWGVVFAANLLGVAAAVGVFAIDGVLPDAAVAAGLGLGRKLLSLDGWTLFARGIIAGWLVATIVWLAHAVREAAGRILGVWIIVYTLAIAQLAHCVVGACEVLFAVIRGSASIGDFAWSFLVPTTLGNVLGGVLVVALINYAQTAEELFPDHRGTPRLSWREWALSRRLGARPTPSDSPETA